MRVHPSPLPSSPRYVVRITAIAALGGLLFGYDTAVINGAIGFLELHFALDATMKGWAASSVLAGCVMGVATAGWLNDRCGRKAALLIAGGLFFVSAIGTALPETFAQFVVFRILAGAGVGFASMTSPMYIAEIAPAQVRGRLVAVNQLAIIGGMLIIYFVNFSIARAGGPEWQVTTSWRWMFGSGLVPSALFLSLLLLAPESPRWLILRGREAKAHGMLVRVGGEEYARAESRAIAEAVREEAERSIKLFDPRVRRVLLVGIALAVLQQVTGINVFLYFGTEIFKQLGSSVDAALLETIVIGAVNLLFTIVAIQTVDRIGRRPLMLIGATGMGLCLAGMGLVAQAGGASVWMLGFILTYIACFALSVGPVTWVILVEIFPNAIRGQALAVATLGLWLANFLVSQTFPMMDASPYLVSRFNHAFPFYLYAAMCVVLVAVVARFVPETKGKSLEEIGRRWVAA
jgi:MFS transporter, SP family, xylose:H+ symportor